jgi:hypothetical protein
LRVAAELASSGARGIAGLQRMTAAQMLAAFVAVTTVDFELTHDGLAWNFGLKLLVEMIFDDVAAAIGALFGQWGVVCLIDLSRGRRLAMGVLAVLIALLATGLFGPLLRFAFGERGGLPLRGAFAFFQLLLQIPNGLPKLFNETILLREPLTQLLILKEQSLKRRRVHTDLDSD